MWFRPIILQILFSVSPFWCIFFDRGQPAANDPLSLSNDTLQCNPEGGRAIKDCDWWWERALCDGSGSGSVVTHCAGQLTQESYFLTRTHMWHTPACIHGYTQRGWQNRFISLSLWLRFFKYVCKCVCVCVCVFLYTYMCTPASLHVSPVSNLTPSGCNTITHFREHNCQLHNKSPLLPFWFVWIPSEPVI